MHWVMVRSQYPVDRLNSSEEIFHNLQLEMNRNFWFAPALERTRLIGCSGSDKIADTGSAIAT